ncbi:MAG: cation-translocating P-type ATPase [Euryarchaeota archaeon]|nr:cation-translocating P-type ATPase [Euryarchaeota archaeon]
MPRVSARSVLEGRARLSVSYLKGDPEVGLAVEDALRRTRGVTCFTANPVTGNVLVFFDPSRVGVEGIIQILENGEVRREVRARRRAVAEESLFPSFLNLAATGTVMTALFLKRLLGGGPAFARSRTMTGIGSATTIVAGYPIFRSSARALLNKDVNVDTLISTAAISTLILRESLTGLVIVWLISLGNFLERLTLRKTRREIEGLLKIGEPYVWVTVDGAEVELPLEELRVGHVVSVHTGERIPVDGAVLSGFGAVDQAPITGESLPVMKNEGDEVYAGSILTSGGIHVRATGIGKDTTMGKIIQLVEEAQEAKAPIQTLADRFSHRFVPLSFLASGLVYALSRDITRSVTMLVIACPCAAGLATPTAVSAAIGNAARQGILIKGGAYLEVAGSMDTVIFDKTGTLTEGIPRVTEVIPLGKSSREEVLALAASSELHSLHPVAKAVVAESREKAIEIPEHAEYEVVVGQGVKATVNGTRVLIGSRTMMAGHGIKITKKAEGLAKGIVERGETVLYVARGGRLAGLIGIGESVRPEAREAIEELRRLGVERLILVTGDDIEKAEAIAHQLGIDEVHGKVLPQGKFDLIKSLQLEGHRVAMVGDGINDAPALAQADVGISLGKAGTDVAIETADIILMGDDVRKVAMTMKISKHTLGVINQNFLASIGINFLGLSMASVGLLPPLQAAVLHNTSTLAVILNSGKIFRYRA